MLMIAYGASIGGIGTPVGSPPNLIAMGMIESLGHYRITFFQWMAFGVPMLIVMFIALFFILKFLHPVPENTLTSNSELLSGMRDEVGIWSRGEAYTLFSFCIAVVLWILPGIIAVWWGSESDTYSSVKGVLDEGIVALIAAVLLFIIPINWEKRTFALTWDQAVKIDWGTIMLFGGGLSLGKLMFDTGLAKVVGTKLTDISGVEGLWSITALSILIGIVVSETTSNTASASMVIPVMIAISQAAGVSPVPPALGGCLGASFGFMLPVSTPPNAIVYGSGMVPILSMIRAGILFDIVGFVIIWCGLRVLCPLLGLM
jgi:sodium-dependent dicarboxylate transporter 2/3/5